MLRSGRFRGEPDEPGLNGSKADLSGRAITAALFSINKKSSVGI
jgi:hypothetical protein